MVFVQLSAMILSVLCREVSMKRLKDEQTCVSETGGVQSESEEKKGTVSDEKTSEEKDMSAGQKVGVTTEFYFHVSPDVTVCHCTLVPDIVTEGCVSIFVEGGVVLSTVWELLVHCVGEYRRHLQDGS